MNKTENKTEIPRATVTKEHRELALVAYAGSVDNALIHELRWMNGEECHASNDTRRLQNIAQLIADAELRGAEGKAGALVGCSERMPEPDTVVIGWKPGWARGGTVFFNGDDRAFYDTEKSAIPQIGVTHWCPMLPPPSSEAK